MMALPPLRFEPHFQYRLWGGRRLGAWMEAQLPDGPIGEAWILSDREDVSSKVADGPFKGRSLTELMASHREDLLGALAGRFERFPLLLKFLDVREMLSVQVHPSASKPDLIPKGEGPKTEAWIVLAADEGSRIYAGLKPNTTETDLRHLNADNVDEHLASFKPQVGQGVVIEAGDVHSLGDGVMVFEVQQNSDVTFRLYDWEHIDQTTGTPRNLQVDNAIECIDFSQGAIEPVASPVVEDGAVRRETCLQTAYFRVERIASDAMFAVGAIDQPRVLVCLEGRGTVANPHATIEVDQGTVILLPSSAEPAKFHPYGRATLLEIAIP